MFHDGRIHIVGPGWSVAERPEGPYKTLSGAMPPVLTVPERGYCAEQGYRVKHSRHYGLVLLVWLATAPVEPHAVVFHDLAGR